MSKQQNSNISGSKLKEVIILMAVCLGIQIGILVTACIIGYILGIKSGGYYIYSLIALCFANIISGFVAVRKTKKNGLLNGIFYSLPSIVFFIIISSVFNTLNIDYHIIISFLLLIFASAAGGVLSVNFIPKPKIKRKR